MRDLLGRATAAAGRAPAVVAWAARCIAASAAADGRGDPGRRAGRRTRAAGDQRGPGAGGQQQRRARRQGADVGGFEDLLAAQRDLLAGAAVAVADGDGPARRAGRPGWPGRGRAAGQSTPAPMTFLVAAPHRAAMPWLAPDGDALLVGLQDGDRDHAAASRGGSTARAGPRSGRCWRPRPATTTIGGSSRPPARSAWRRPARITVSVSAAISGDAADRDFGQQVEGVAAGRERGRVERRQACRRAAG